MNRRQFNMITGASAVSTLFDRPRAGFHEIRNTTSWAVSANTSKPCDDPAWPASFVPRACQLMPPRAAMTLHPTARAATVLRVGPTCGRSTLNLGNFLRRLALPQSVKHWSLTTLRDKLSMMRADGSLPVNLTNTPDGKYIAFSHGPNAQQHVGRMAREWHTCVADAAETNVWVTLTTVGESNKEPDWVRVAPGDAKP